MTAIPAVVPAVVPIPHLMSKNSITLPSWMPDGILALDVESFSAEVAVGRIMEPRAAIMDTDPAWLREEVEATWGLRRYPELGCAIQPVRGVMCPGANRWAEWCGMFNTDRIGLACRTIAADPMIDVLILEMETPGGYTSGCEEAAAAVQSLPALKKGATVLAWTGRLCASAGAWIAAAAEKHYAAPSATLGSIGTIATLTDSSRAWREMGLDRFVATDGKYKAMGMAGVPITDDHKQLIQQGVMETSATFKGYLRERRGIADDDMQGQTFVAKKAPPGLHDGTQFSSLEELLAVVAKGKL